MSSGTRAGLVGQACSERARTYAPGLRLDSEWSVGWQGIETGSCATGKRTVTCFVGHHDGADWVTVTGAIRGTPD